MRRWRGGSRTGFPAHRRAPRANAARPYAADAHTPCANATRTASAYAPTATTT